MGRNPCCPKEGMNRGAWTAVEDKELVDYIASHGEGKWRNIPKVAGLKRCGKSCRLRWLNYLRPGIKRGNISEDEEDLIIRLHKLLGNRWSLIAGRLPGRTDIEIKNYWNSNLSKKEQPKKQKLTNCSTELITKEDKENNPTLKMASGKTSKTVSPEQPPSLLPPLPFQSLPPEFVPNIELSGILESDFSMFGELDEAKGDEEGAMAEDWGELGCVQDIEFLMSSEFGSMASICNTQMNGIFDSL